MDVAENLLAHPVNNVLSHFLQHPGIRGIEDKPQQKHEKIKGCRHQDSVKIGEMCIRDRGMTTNLIAENIKAASIVISMLPMLIVYPFVQKFFTKGIMIGAVKG